jgi:single-strand DNA-binding protein
MANLNKVLLIGRLTADPEVRYTASGLNIASLRMAVNNYRKGPDGNRIEEACFIDCTAFGKTGELAQQYLKKGRQVFIEGHLRFEQWDDKNTGQKRSKHTVTVDNIQFLDGKGGEGGVGSDGGDFAAGGAGGGKQYSGRQASPADQPPMDDDIPF